jgi:cytochrome P450
VAIPAGSDVYMGWAAANRDPSMFPAPTAFRLDRGPNRHLSFGTGIHMCPGAPLARMELKIVLQELLDRIPDLRLEIAEPAYRFGGGDYAYIESLPAVFSPQPAP